MKTGRLLLILILSCWFLAPLSLLRAEENEWYQGHQGQWRQQGKSWRWTSTHGDDWYQGRQGNWYDDGRNGWEYHTNDGDEYRKRRSGWAWAYHTRNPRTDTRSYQQFKQQEQ